MKDGRYLGICMLAAWMVMSPVRGAVEREGSTMFYRGPISEAQNNRFFALAGAKGVSRLVIASGGGDVDAAIRLGRWIHANRVDVEVPGICLSSCANYVFTAARKKRIHPGAVVAWHGSYTHLERTGLWRDEIAVRMRKYGEDAHAAEAAVVRQVNRLVDLERRFFETVGVDGLICWIGKLPPYAAPDYYFLSVADMARFGVTQVTVPPAYETTDTSGIGADIRFLRLADGPAGGLSGE